MMMRKHSHRSYQGAALVAASLVAASTMVSASESALLDALVENGHLTAEQAEEIQGQGQPAVTPLVDNFRNFRIRGLIHTQAGYVNASTGGDENWSTVELRRVRLGVEGELLQNVLLNVEGNFIFDEDNVQPIRSAYLQWREYEPAYIKVGFDRPAFGLERTTDSANMLTIERSNVTETVIDGDMVGVAVDGTHEAVPILDYSAGLYTNQLNMNEPNELARYLYNLSGQLTLDEYMPEGHRLSSRLDFIFNDDRAGDIIFIYDRGTSWGTHYQWEDLDVRGEILWAELDGSDDVFGWYLQPAYHFTEKLQGVLRYEMVNADADVTSPSRYAANVPELGAGTTGDDYWAFYLGGNYYIRGDDHKLMAGLEYSELENGDTLEATTLSAAWRAQF